MYIVPQKLCHKTNVISYTHICMYYINVRDDIITASMHIYLYKSILFISYYYYYC